MTAYLFFVRAAQFAKGVWQSFFVLGMICGFSGFMGGVALVVLVAYWLLAIAGTWFLIWGALRLIGNLLAPPSKEELAELGLAPKTDQPPKAN